MIYPEGFVDPWRKWAVAHFAAGLIAKLAPARRAVVQAGGCSGMWPLALSAYFEHVYTFEPAVANFRCLQANVATTPNISAFDCALSDKRGLVGLTRPKPRAGLWRVEGAGDVQTVRLDDFFGDVAVDALVLDVEGSEIKALLGAERLIDTHRPLLWCEMLHNVGEIEAFMAAHEYVPPRLMLGSDGASVHASQWDGWHAPA